jgi:hypothetical protein
MSLRLALFRYLPAEMVRRRILVELAQATAEAFGATPPTRHGAPSEARLAAYTDFTAAEAGRLVRDGPAPDETVTNTAKERLYQRATELGSVLRRRLGIRRPEEALEALKLLYHQIGIEVTGRIASDASGASGDNAGAPGDAYGASAGAGGTSADIQVTRCFFAGYYTEPVCRLMGALDAGVADGLFGGASLEFSERMTDGSFCCRAVIKTRRART